MVIRERRDGTVMALTIRPHRLAALCCSAIAVSWTVGRPRLVTVMRSPASARSMYQPKWLRNSWAPTVAYSEEWS